MKKFALPSIVLAALALVLTAADGAEAAVRRVYVSSYTPHVRVVTPIRRVYPRRVLITQPVIPVIYSPLDYNSTIIVPHGNHLHVVPTHRSLGLWGPVLW